MGVLRVGEALFAGIASLGWIVERTLNVRMPVDAVVNGVAHYAVWIAVGLLVVSVGAWGIERMGGRVAVAGVPERVN